MKQIATLQRILSIKKTRHERCKTRRKETA